MMYAPSKLPNTRIDVADVLRGIAIAGIILIHSIEQYNFYFFPAERGAVWTAINQGVWDTTFFLFAGKMYAIFALLFGLSFFIQHDNQAQKGRDFRGRFAWRLLLLFVIGMVNVTIYNGDILTLYAVCGFFLIPLIRAKDWLLWTIFAVLLIQPIEACYVIGGLINPDLQPFSLGSGKLMGGLTPTQASGTFWAMCKESFLYGMPANFLWSIEVGRFTQTIYLFIFGMLIGRKRLFYNEGNNLRIWKRVLIGSTIAFAVLLPLYYTIPSLFETRCVSQALNAQLNMWKNFAMMLMIVSSVVLLFYKTSFRDKLMVMAPYGKMSLTNYVGQSLIGALLFYNWGLGLYRYLGHTESLVIGFLIVVLQMTFCHWWLKNHKRGPLEDLWRRCTWVGTKA